MSKLGSFLPTFLNFLFGTIGLIIYGYHGNELIREIIGLTIFYTSDITSHLLSPFFIDSNNLIVLNIWRWFLSCTTLVYYVIFRMNNEEEYPIMFTICMTVFWESQIFSDMLLFIQYGLNELYSSVYGLILNSKTYRKRLIENMQASYLFSQQLLIKLYKMLLSFSYSKRHLKILRRMSYITFSVFVGKEDSSNSTNNKLSSKNHIKMDDPIFHAKFANIHSKNVRSTHVYVSFLYHLWLYT